MVQRIYYHQILESVFELRQLKYQYHLQVFHVLMIQINFEKEEFFLILYRNVTCGLHVFEEQNYVHIDL